MMVIRPSTALRNEYAEISRLCRERGEPVFITRNGEGDLVVQSLFDSGRFDDLEKEVYSFSQDAGDQSYWLARAYLVLGDSFAERGQYAQAKATYESIRDGYEPENGSDDVADNVKMRLDRLATLMKD